MTYLKIVRCIKKFMKAKQNNLTLKQSFEQIKRIFKYASPFRVYLYLSLFCYLASSVLLALIPLYIGDAVDYIVGAGNVNFDMVLKYIKYLILCIVVGGVLDWLATVFENKLSYATALNIRKDLFDKILKLPFSYLDRMPRGDYLSRMVNDVENITDGFLEGLTVIFSGAVSIVLNIVLMFKLNWVLALIVVACTPLSVFVTLFVAKRSKKMYIDHANATGDASAFIEEMFSNQKVVKAFSYEDRALAGFDIENEKLYKSGVKSHFYGSLGGPTTRVVNGIIYGVVGFTGSMLAINGRVSVGVISSFLSYADQYARPFNEISGVISEVQQALASCQRVFEVIDQTNEPDDSLLPALTNCDGSVEIENMSFSYSPKNPLIQNFNLKVKPGQKVAIVGPTGCGKTTFINLLMRFYDVTNGSIKLGETPINSITRHSLREQYGMVLQESWLFSGTIRDNIAFGRPSATLEEVEAAAKMAGAHDFIMMMERGYNTIINENGDNISQGQKQLLCIARIILVKPKLLILDEATSNIDTRAEMEIQKAFNAIMKGKTSFVVAHRLSTIVGSDIILVMRKGQIVEQGTHEELLKKKGFYHHLYNSQFNVV